MLGFGLVLGSYRHHVLDSADMRRDVNMAMLGGACAGPTWRELVKFGQSAGILKEGDNALG